MAYNSDDFKAVICVESLVFVYGPAHIDIYLSGDYQGGVSPIDSIRIWDHEHQRSRVTTLEEFRQAVADYLNEKED